MAPRSYEFTCRVCGKEVKESSDSDVCSNCAANPVGGAPVQPILPPPAPVKKAPAAPGAPKGGGFRVTIRSVSVCKACMGTGQMDGAPCLVCGGKKK